MLFTEERGVEAMLKDVNFNEVDPRQVFLLGAQPAA